MGETLNLIAVLEDIQPQKLWLDLSRLTYIEETDEGLSIVPLSKLTNAKLKKDVLNTTHRGMKLRGYSSKNLNQKINKILNYDIPEIKRPLFGLMPDQQLLTFTFETEKGLGVEYVEYMLQVIEADLGIEFEPAEEYELEDFSDDEEAHNLALLRRIAEEEGLGDEDSWFDEEESEEEDYPRRFIKEKENEDKGDKNKGNPFK